MSLTTCAILAALVCLAKWGGKRLALWAAKFFRVIAIGFVLASATAFAEDPPPEEPPPEPVTIEPATVQCFALGFIAGVVLFSVAAKNFTV